MMSNQRLSITIRGQVQGVGFRPQIYRIAKSLELTGWVANSAEGLMLEIQGERAAEFLPLLNSQLPPLAIVDSIVSHRIAFKPHDKTFSIHSSYPGKVNTRVMPDVAVCQECLQELFDPDSRFYHYPFLNCTHCGPRYTITRQLPYDRKQTSMVDFPMCTDCQADYEDPENRRYHAQPTACSRCGPEFSHTISEMTAAIKEGKIIALKGLGGYQLICDARNEETVIKLRERKQREQKPFALMFTNLISLKELLNCDREEEQLLTSWQRPIVLLQKRYDSLPDAIAPGLSHLGAMLPYTPAHYLLFHALANASEGLQWLEEFQSTILVVTSANPSGLPLIIEDEQAKKELNGIADEVINYNRAIVTRADDSVMRLVDHKPCFIRRARSFTPQTIKLSYPLPPTLALGGHLKNTFCIVRGKDAFVSQHIGDLDNGATIDYWNESLEHLIKITDVQPEIVAHDLHPDFYTSRFAEEYGIPHVPVQHHHAHLAAVAAEHHIETPILGLALDGYGYGSDGGSWGGELFLLEGAEFERLSSLQPIKQPGGDKAAKEPWRMAAAILNALGRSDEITQRFSQQPLAGQIQQHLETNSRIPLTTSCGRMFDAASALLGICLISKYEGQAAMQLESLVTNPIIIKAGWCIDNDELNLLPLFERLLQCDPITGANLFHGTLAAAIADWLFYWSAKTGIKQFLLSGGCFLNKILTEGLLKMLKSNDLISYLPRQLPPNDGGISLGQAWIAGNLLKSS